MAILPIDSEHSAIFLYLSGSRPDQIARAALLGELAIEKLLAARYPRLLAWQVSCHAARLEGGQALPCGACARTASKCGPRSMSPHQP